MQALAKIFFWHLDYENAEKVSFFCVSLIIYKIVIFAFA